MILRKIDPDPARILIAEGLVEVRTPNDYRYGKVDRLL